MTNTEDTTDKEREKIKHFLNLMLEVEDQMMSYCGGNNREHAIKIVSTLFQKQTNEKSE